MLAPNDIETVDQGPAGTGREGSQVLDSVNETKKLDFSSLDTTLSPSVSDSAHQLKESAGAESASPNAIKSPDSLVFSPMSPNESTVSHSPVVGKAVTSKSKLNSSNLKPLSAKAVRPKGNNFGSAPVLKAAPKKNAFGSTALVEQALAQPARFK